MHDGYDHAIQQAKGHEALFTVAKAVVFKGIGNSLEYARSINEVQSMVRRASR